MAFDELKDGWKPIESAPLDGTRVLLFGPLSWTAGVSPQQDDIEPTVFEAYYAYGGWQGKGGYRPSPTHWMPLPLPPRKHKARDFEPMGRTTSGAIGQP